jgi:hypothetical protein
MLPEDHITITVSIGGSTEIERGIRIIENLKKYEKRS